jgi:hypothetical protein
VAAGADVLLSAVLGHAALRVLTRTDISVLTTRGALEDVREYLPLIASLGINGNGVWLSNLESC